MADTETRLPKMAFYLGYAGLLPFVGLAIASVAGVKVQTYFDVTTEFWLAIYAAVIISFLGAIHWGVVIAIADKLDPNENNTLLFYSVIPSLLAWFSFLLNMKYTLFLMGLIILFCYFMDRLILFKKLNNTINTEFSRLRLHLTIVVSIALFISAISLS